MGEGVDFNYPTTIGVSAYQLLVDVKAPHFRIGEAEYLVLYVRWNPDCSLRGSNEAFMRSVDVQHAGNGVGELNPGMTVHPGTLCAR
ncbi:hypothetical protein D3C81_1908740 [compost metagenome]